ncbi:MAG: hypothetical protein HFH91_16275 [Lachnospiraceae bacterium]|nr:hypothetical protein [Lachnospiraceae bacterium]
MEETSKWKEPGTLRPLSDPIAQTPQREIFETQKKAAKMILESYDWDTVIYARLQRIKKKEMKPGEEKIWEAMDAADFNETRRLAEKLLDEEPEYGWGYFYQLITECRISEGPLGLYPCLYPPNGVLVSENEPEGYHKARRCYNRAQRFADESLTEMFGLLEDLVKSNQFYEKAQNAMEKQNYKDVMFFCLKMPIRKYLDSGDFVEKAIQELYNGCKKAEFTRLKESGFKLEQVVKEKNPALYDQWLTQANRLWSIASREHGAETSTLILAIIALVFSVVSFTPVPVFMLLLGFALETTLLEFHFFRGLLLGVFFTGVTMAPGLMAGITDHWYYISGMKAVGILVSLWFLRCGIYSQKYKAYNVQLQRWNAENIRPISEGILEEIAEEYKIMPDLEDQFDAWRRNCRWY